jgi:hypothetical protein
MDIDFLRRLPRVPGNDGQRHGSHRYIVVAVLCLACNSDSGVILAPATPTAYTRFVHAVPDTGGTDWRFIDQMEGSPVAFGLVFRGFTPYQATATGSRRLRVFPSSTNINVTSRFLVDTTLVFEADTYYTIAHIGFARDGASPRQQILVLTDGFPRAATPTVAVRAVHLGVGLPAVDVFGDTLGGASPLPEHPLAPDLSPGTANSYAAIDAGRLVLRVTRTGETAPMLATAVAPAGEAGAPQANLTAIGGSRMPGSAMSALLFPRSVAGSSAPQAPAFANPALTVLIDRHPR